MGSFGREELYKIGSTGLTVTADGAPIAKHAGATLLWKLPNGTNAIAPVAEEKTFKHDDFVAAGEQFIRYGTVICRIMDGANKGKFVPFGTVGAGTLATAAEARGNWYIVNESIHEGDRNSDYPAAIEGGRVYARRLLVVGLGDGTGEDADEVGEGKEKYAGAAAENAADLAALGLTAVPLADFLAAFPMITLVRES